MVFIARMTDELLHYHNATMLHLMLTGCLCVMVENILHTEYIHFTRTHSGKTAIVRVRVILKTSIS